MTPGEDEPLRIDPSFFPFMTEIGPGVLGYTVEHDNEIYVPLVAAASQGAGDVGRYFDSLPADKTIIVPNVMSARLAGILTRRGFTERPWPFTEEDGFNEEIPAYVREKEGT